MLLLYWYTRVTKNGKKIIKFYDRNEATRMLPYIYFCVSAMFEYTAEGNGYSYEWVLALIFGSNVKELRL
jgi:hypothetical protein